MDKSSLFKFSGLPDAFGAAVLIFSLAIALAPYFSGADFGIFKIPALDRTSNKCLKVIGPILFVLITVTFIPVFPSGTRSQTETKLLPSPTAASSTFRLGDEPDYSKHRRVADPSFLHPLLREKASKLLERARLAGINLFYYETYRGPREQHDWYMIGRTKKWVVTNEETVEEIESVVTQTDAWANPKQYGLAVEFLPFERGQWEEEPDDFTRDRLFSMAASLGLARFGRQLTFVMPDIKIADLKAGSYPKGGDQSWADNLNGNIEAWGAKDPKAPPRAPVSPK